MSLSLEGKLQGVLNFFCYSLTSKNCVSDKANSSKVLAEQLQVLAEQFHNVLNSITVFVSTILSPISYLDKHKHQFY